MDMELQPILDEISERFGITPQLRRGRLHWQDGPSTTEMASVLSDSGLDTARVPTGELQACTVDRCFLVTRVLRSYTAALLCLRTLVAEKEQGQRRAASIRQVTEHAKTLPLPPEGLRPQTRTEDVAVALVLTAYAGGPVTGQPAVEHLFQILDKLGGPALWDRAAALAGLGRA
jgi:hypothetical protein